MQCKTINDSKKNKKIKLNVTFNRHLKSVPEKFLFADCEKTMKDVSEAAVEICSSSLLADDRQQAFS